MTGLVVATHSRLAEELLLAAEMIIGSLSQAKAVSILREDSPEEIRQRIDEAIVAVGEEGVIIMTDMFGGTPANISLSFLESDRVEVLTGVNLPMVLKFFNSQSSMALSEQASMLKAYGQQSISQPSELLKK